MMTMATSIKIATGIQVRRSRFFFLNHGETDWDLKGRFAGRINAPLNGRGLAQARRAGEMLRDAGVSVICTSPQDRALTTAEIVAAHIHAPVVVVGGLKDCCFGDRDGSVPGDWFSAWRHGETPEGAESADNFRARTVAAMNLALDRPGPILVVAHPAIYVAFHLATGLPTEITPETAGTPICHEPQHRPHAGWKAAPIAA
jgi:probable phosphoglycerate mutase